MRKSRSRVGSKVSSWLASGLFATTLLLGIGARWRDLHQARSGPAAGDVFDGACVVRLVAYDYVLVSPREPRERTDGEQDPFEGHEQARAAASAVVASVARARGAPVLDSAERILGTRRLDLTPEARQQMDGIDLESIRARARICVADNGMPVSVEILQSAGFRSLDEKLRRELMDWRYRPQRMDGDRVPFCEQVTFRYEVDSVAPR